MPSAARSLALTTAASVVGLTASLVVTAAAPRLLGTSDLAQFFAIASAIGVAGQLGALSLPELVMRQAAQPDDGLGRADIALACARSLAVTGILVTALMYDVLGTGSLLLLAWVPLAGLSRLTAVVVRLQGSDVLGSSIGEVARRLGMAGGLLAVWAFGGGWGAVAVAGMIGELLFLLRGARAASVPSMPAWRWGQAPAMTVEIWRRGGQHALAGLTRLVVTTAGPLLLAIRLGPRGADDVTELGMILRLTAVGGLLAVTCTRALAAWTVRAALDDSGSLEHRRRVERWSLTLMVLSFLPGLLATRSEFTSLVFGEQGQLISTWTALASGVAVAFISGGALRYQELIVNLGPQRVWPASIVIVSAWTGLGLALAEPFGAAGVAVVSAACAMAYFGVLVVIGRRHLPTVEPLHDTAA